jgi:hypothetical protein
MGRTALLPKTTLDSTPTILGVIDWGIYAMYIIEFHRSRTIDCDDSDR